MKNSFAANSLSASLRSPKFISSFLKLLALVYIFAVLSFSLTSKAAVFSLNHHQTSSEVKTMTLIGYLGVSQEGEYFIQNQNSSLRVESDLNLQSFVGTTVIVTGGFAERRILPVLDSVDVGFNPDGDGPSISPQQIFPTFVVVKISGYNR